jgi:hypothetical protein
MRLGRDHEQLGLLWSCLRAGLVWYWVLQGSRLLLLCRGFHLLLLLLDLLGNNLGL